jgi:hypothetical protein
MTKGINDQYFALFKMQLALFIKANYNPCSGFIQGIEKATDASNLTLHFSKNADSILEHLGGGNSENKISKLESEISNLSDECNEFYNKLEILEGIFGPTLNNEFMREHYAMYAHNFQEWELEELLKNGKE